VDSSTPTTTFIVNHVNLSSNESHSLSIATRQESPKETRETVAQHGIEAAWFTHDENRRQMQRISGLVNSDHTDQEMMEIAERNKLKRQERKQANKNENRLRKLRIIVRCHTFRKQTITSTYYDGIPLSMQTSDSKIGLSMVGPQDCRHRHRHPHQIHLDSARFPPQPVSEPP
jgi:hypothetical protein